MKQLCAINNNWKRIYNRLTSTSVSNTTQQEQNQTEAGGGGGAGRVESLPPTTEQEVEGPSAANITTQPQQAGGGAGRTEIPITEGQQQPGELPAALTQQTHHPKQLAVVPEE